MWLITKPRITAVLGMLKIVCPALNSAHGFAHSASLVFSRAARAFFTFLSKAASTSARVLKFAA